MSSLAEKWAELSVEEWVRLGAEHVGIAPGARSAPLVLAVAKHPSLTVCLHFDERSLGFWALGIGKASKKPAVIITTSGTAVANLLPAVIEASLSDTPMILVTADRPHELHDIGANQTIKQEGLFNAFVRWETTLPPPTTEIPPTSILSTMDYAWFKATQHHPGPVHINCMYREPLLEGEVPETYTDGLAAWQTSKTPFTVYSKAGVASDPEQLARCNARIQASTKGCFIAGTLTKPEAKLLFATAKLWNWPIIAEAGSGLSFVNHPLIIPFPQANLLERDLSIVVGDPITLKSVESVCQRCSETITIHTSLRRLDPMLRGGERLIGTLSDLLPKFQKPRDTTTFPPLTQADPDLNNLPLNEETAVQILTKHTKPHRAFFCGNSLSIRLLTTYSHRHLNDPIATFVNRGASGIDGNFATVAGLQTVLKQPLIVLIGDQAALHDLTSLHLLSKLNLPTCILILNNHGGKIFSKVLPSKIKNHLDYFQAPHHLSFEHAAKQFDLRYAEITTTQHLSDWLINYDEQGPLLLEISCTPKETE